MAGADPGRYGGGTGRRSRYELDMLGLADALRTTRRDAPDDRIGAIRLYERIAERLRARALEINDRILAGSAGDEAYVAEGEVMELYAGAHDVLVDGWGCDCYSGASVPDGHDERLLRSLVTVVDATSLVMPGYDLNKRAYEAVDQHALTTTGRLAVSALAGEARALESMCEYAMDEHDHRHGTVDDRRRVEALRAARRVQHGDLSWRWRGFRLGPDDRLGIDEYLRGLIDWRFDSDAVPEYWEHRARLTERVLGLNQDELFTLLVTGIGESPCRPPYESRNLSGYLEVPEEFGKPMYRAREAGLFELAELLYREGLYEYLRALITSMYPEAALWSTSLRALWALGLAEEIPTRATAWGDDF